MLGCITLARRGGSARLSSDWLRSVRLDAAQLGSAQLGAVWCGSARLKTIATQGIADSWTQIVAVPEAAKSDTSCMILIFLFFQSFHLFTNFKKHKVAEIRGPLLVPPRRQQKATHPI